MKHFLFLCLFSIISLSLFAQKHYEKGSKVRVHTLSDVQHLNTLTATGAQSTNIASQTHQSLYHIDPITYECVPVLAKGKAKLYIKDGIYHYDYEIRKEAKWDNGTEITGHDLAFSLKLNFVPDARTEPIRSYLDYVEDVVVNKENPKKFTIICKRPYMSAETSIAANQYFMPQYIYDPENVLDDYTVKDLLSDDEQIRKKLRKDDRLIRYAEYFNGSIFKYEITSGSGPYEFIDWENNKVLELKRKKDWWGDKVKNEDKTAWHIAYPEYIEYITIANLNKAMTAMEKGDIDAMHSCPPNRFVELKKKKPDAFHYLNPPLFAYDYIGINTKNPILADRKVRYALNYLMDVDCLIKEELYGLGERSVTFVHSRFKEKINPNLKQHGFNIKKAKKILRESGWADTDGDGIIDKIIDGEKTAFSIRIDFNNGNLRRQKTGELFKEAAKKVGIEVEIIPLEWATYLDKHNKHDFELYVAGWVASPMESDPKQIWHTESYEGGSNYTGFGTPKTDSLIEKLRITPEYEKRLPMYHQLQKAIDEERPYIFLLSKKNTVLISKKFTNAYGTGLRSGVFPQHLKLAK